MYNIEKIKNTIICGEALEELKKIPDGSIDTIITSPPYWGLRDYGVKGQLGLEKTLEEYLEKFLFITKELKRTLKSTGIMFWNHGDCYGGIKFGKTDKKISDYVKDSQKDLKKYVPNFTKCLMIQNWRLILDLIDKQNWILRNTIIWHKPNHMPSSVKDRFANSYEPIFMLVKNKKYYFDLNAIRIKCITNEGRLPGVVRKRIFNYRIRDAEKKAKMCPQFKASKKEIEKYKKQKFITPEQNKETENKTGWIKGSGRIRSFFDNYGGGYNPLGKNPGDVWQIATQPFVEAHFATFPQKLIEPMVKAGCPEGGIILDPFMGSGTTALVAHKLKRNFIGIEKNPDYVKMAQERLRQSIML